VISNSSRTALKIVVDAEVQVLFVASVSHNISSAGDRIKVLTVDNIPQAADIAIINSVCAGDIVVTGDYGLASLVLSKRASPVSSRGFVFSEENIDRLLTQRHIEQRLRRGGGRTKGPRALLPEDRQRFEKVLRKLVYSG
jgi:uncharacterized protein YaiI (UPF0178 family)